MARVMDWDIKIPTDRLIEQFHNVQFGDRREDVDAALRLLIEQIATASRQVESAFQRHLIDVADANRKAAEERLAELETEARPI
jgi:hypothetical protein